MTNDDSFLTGSAGTVSKEALDPVIVAHKTGGYVDHNAKQAIPPRPGEHLLARKAGGLLMTVSKKLQEEIKKAKSKTLAIVESDNENRAKLLLQDALQEPNVRIRLEKLEKLEQEFCEGSDFGY